jgi:hypothetical protein
MKPLDKKGFKLPYVDSLTYRELLRLGLRYDRTQKTYSAEDLDSASMDSVLELLSKILQDKACFTQTTETVGNTARAAQTCLVCRKQFPCQECRYYELCETRNLPLSCICGKCLEEGKTLPGSK